MPIGYPELDRRQFLRESGVATMVSVLPRGVAAGESTGTTTVLGGFESGLDDWKTNGGNKLRRVSNDEFAGAVTQGSRALAVRTDGDPYPMIENKKRVQKADFKNSPHLVADVLPVVADTNADVVFTFRFHHNDTPARGNRGGGGNREKPVLVVESPERHVPQFTRSRIVWDMSDIAEETLAAPKRIEIAWYPADHPPSGGPRGRGPGSFDYQGFTLFDNIHLTDNPADVGTAALRNTFRDLRLDHGQLTTVETEQLGETSESGRFVFADGAEVPYGFEVVGTDRFVYEIDGEQFKIGGGWT